MEEKTAIVYVRVSTARQAEEELPIESQIVACEKKAKTLDAKIVKIFADEGISGRSDVRPAFQDAIAHCEVFRPDYMITWSTSRFARNRVDAGLYKRRLEQAGVKLIYCSIDINLEDDSGWMTDSVLEIFDELYSRQISQDTKRSMMKNATEGYWNGGCRPFGFRVIPDPANEKRRRLAPDESEAAIVQKIFDLRIEGHGAKTLAFMLNAQGAAESWAALDKEFNL